MKGKELITRQTEKLLDAAVRIQGQGVGDRGELGFTARSLVLCTMPHSKPENNVFERTNGNYTLTMLAPPKVGLPYGALARILVAWISTEIVKTKNKNLTLGGSLAEFLEELDLAPTGGKKGSITRLREQMRRLFACYISCDYHDEKRDANDGFKIFEKSETWWHPQNPDQAGLWQSNLTVSDKFYEEVLAAPIPIDMGALKALRRSPMQLDLYLWLTFRHSYLKTETAITWAQLSMQFGAEYGRERAFREAFKDALKKVQLVYPLAKIQTVDAGIVIAPSVPHVPRNGKRLSIG